MSGRLIQFVSEGAQDIYQPEPAITMFRVTYRRYNNFSIPDREENIRTNPVGTETASVVKNSTKRALKSELNINNNENCPICMECMINKEIVICKGCKQYFDEACIENWISSHNTCPLCRCNMFV